MGLLRSLLLLLACAACCGAVAPPAPISVVLRFDGPSATGRLKTSPTLQVVTNPLLDSQFHLPNGSVIPNPIYEAAWNSLGNLGADYVRFQPWFPYPHKAVPELDPPHFLRKTSWDFSHFLPQLEDFMKQTAARGHPVIWNFGTIPCWMFGLAGCSYPKDPNQAYFDYGDKGVRPLMEDQSGRTLAGYFGRIMAYLTRGQMVDEHGAVHAGGPTYNFSRTAGHIFEFLNEGEHHYSPEDHVHDYDVVVPEIIRSMGGSVEDAPAFMGIGGCQNGDWAWWFMGNCSKWLPVFLDPARHHNAGAPRDYASVHYYASASNRFDVGSYTRGFFNSADSWFEAMDANLALRDRLAPNTKIAMTELGTLMTDDMSKSFGRDGGLPDLYWNAAGAFYAYVFGHMSTRDIEFLCLSQLVGSPAIPEWNINEMQFPSASMLSWETGLGNAKYWVLKLLIDHLRKGEQIFKATVDPATQVVPNRQVLCEAVGHWNFDGSVTLTCEGEGSTIEEIWADAGEAPTGECGAYVPNKNCSSHLLVTAWASHKCKGKKSCTLGSSDVAVNAFSCPFKILTRKVDPHDVMLTVQARCSGQEGGSSSADYTGAQVFAVGFASPTTRRVLLVNKEAKQADIALDAADFPQGATAYIVDPSSAQRSAAQGIREETWAPSLGNVVRATLQPYAVAVVEYDVPGARQAAAFV